MLIACNSSRPILFNAFIAQDNNEVVVLDALESVVRKRVLLKMRRNDYNIKFPHSSVSVSQFMMCEDLMDQFNEANDDDAPGGGGGDCAVVVSPMVAIRAPIIFSL